MALPRPHPPRQLALPHPLPAATSPPRPLVPPRPPAAVWPTLAPAQQAQVRAALVALLQEVAHVGDAPGEDHPAAS
jgi:hypothetical protein